MIRTTALRASALAVAATLVALPAAAQDEPQGFVDPQGVEYDQPHDDFGGFVLLNPAPYCDETGEPQGVVLVLVNHSDAPAGHRLSAGDSVISEQDVTPVRQGDLIDVPLTDWSDGELGQLLRLEVSTMPEVVSYAYVTHDGSCEGRPASRDEAFNFITSNAGPTITQYYRTGSTTEQPGSGSGGQDGSGGEVQGPLVQTGTGAPSGGPAESSSALGTLALAGLAALGLGTATTAAARRR